MSAPKSPSSGILLGLGDDEFVDMGEGEYEGNEDDGESIRVGEGTSNERRECEAKGEGNGEKDAKEMSRDKGDDGDITESDEEGEDEDDDEDEDSYNSLDEDVPSATNAANSSIEHHHLEGNFSSMLINIIDGKLTADAADVIQICTFLHKSKTASTWMPEELVKILKRNDVPFEKLKGLILLLLDLVPNFPLWMNDYRENILHRAVKSCLYEAVEFLCERSVEAISALRQPNLIGDTCLHIAIQKESKPEFVRKLMDWVGTATVEAVGSDRNTPLHVAVQYALCNPGQLALVEDLLKRSEATLIIKNQLRLAPLQYHLQKRSEYIQTKMEQERRIRDAQRIAATDGDEGARVAANVSKPKKRKNKKTIKVTEEEGAIKAAADARRKEAAEKEEARRKEAAKKDEARRIESEGIELLLKLHCLRLNLDRDETMSLLYGSDQTFTIAFDLWGYKIITQEDLAKMTKHLRFERILQYIVLPNLSVISAQPSPQDKLPTCKGRTDYWWIFKWLKQEKVARILRVVVQDRQPSSHSDEMVERCLEGLQVETWDWNKLDICATTIQRAAPSVRDLTLYSSGNNAVLRSWSSAGGLVQLKDLKTIRLKVHQGLESLDRMEKNIKNFERELKGRLCKHPTDRQCTHECLAVITEMVDSDGDLDMLALDLERELEEDKQPWMACMENFAIFIKNYEDPAGSRVDPPEIKVALIDDGVDAAHGSLSSVIEDGESFSKRSNGLYSSYYKSSRGHGTIMATLIRKVCPGVKLYVAKLNEERRDNGFEITAASAVKAVKWAIKKKVQVISMSWTINATERNKGDIENLTTAINEATEGNILLFCSVSDQGVKTEGAYPANCNRSKTFRIGAATTSGNTWEWVGVNDVNYIFPGTGLRVDTRDPLSKSLKPCSGSSLATALAAGLAALILYCIALNNAEELDLVLGHDKMDHVFKSINDTRDSSLFLRVWEAFKVEEDAADRPKESLKFIVDGLLGPLRRQEGRKQK